MKHTQKFLQKRKFAMVLPLLVLPFLTMIFWALGGGKGTPAQAHAIEQTGLNLELPNAHFNVEEVWNKLNLYEQAERDSLRFQEAIENDPYFDFTSLENQQKVEQKSPPIKKGNPSNFTDRKSSRSKEIIDPNEARVNQKLEELYRELNKSPKNSTEIETEKIEQQPADPQFSAEVEKLEQMMELMSEGNQSDPEMKQIESMLDKILDIQHPDRVREKTKVQIQQRQDQTFAVEALRQDNNITLMKSLGTEPANVTDSAAFMNKSFVTQNSFYGLEEDSDTGLQSANAIEAVVHDTQELVTGATIKLRLLTDVYIKEHLIEKDQFIYGTCAIKAERLTIDINSIRSEKSLLPVSLSVYDLDGLEGIYIPGAITHEVVKQSSDQALQGMQFVSMDQSLGAQAASAGIQAATGLFGKKIKTVKVTVKAGYKILLQDGNAR